MEKEKKNKKNDIIIKDDEKEIVIPKYKQKGMLDHFMILLGVIAATLAFVVIFDLFFERSLFGFLFLREEYNYCRAMELGSLRDFLYKLEEEGKVVVQDVESVSFSPIFDNPDLLFSQMSPIIYTIILIISAIGLVMLVIRYIRDYVEVVKSLFKAFKDLKKGAITSIKEVVEASDIVVKKKDIVTGEKSKFISTLTSEVKEEDKEKKKRKYTKRNEQKEVQPIDSEDAELNRLLMGGEPLTGLKEEPKVEEDIDPNYKTKSLFADKD